MQVVVPTCRYTARAGPSLCRSLVFSSSSHCNKLSTVSLLSLQLYIRQYTELSPPAIPSLSRRFLERETISFSDYIVPCIELIDSSERCLVMNGRKESTPSALMESKTIGHIGRNNQSQQVLIGKEMESKGKDNENGNGAQHHQQKLSLSHAPAAVDSSKDKSNRKKDGLYITIGPQCSGKTTFLSKLSSGGDKFLDVSMDSVPGTYEEVAVAAIQNYQETGELTGPLLKRAHQRFLYEYIDDLQAGEQLALLLFFTGDISHSELCDHLASCPGISPANQLLIGNVAKQVHSSGIRVTTRTVGIFIRASMGFAVKQALRDLTAAAHSHPGPVGWGNTNLSAREYKVALAVAHEANRSVHFVVWGTTALPPVPLHELFRRNLLRFLRSGKYIPLSVMGDYVTRADALVARLRDPEHSREELARLGGYDVDAEGFVTPAAPAVKAKKSSSNGKAGKKNKSKNKEKKTPANNEPNL